MTVTPDRYPGTYEDEEIRLVDDGSGDPSQQGGMKYQGGAFRFRDSIGPFNPRSGGGGITEGEHEDLDTLVHWLSETGYQEIVRTAGKVSSVIYWTTAGKTKKVREMIVTRAAGKTSQLDFVQYNAAGAEKQRLTGVLARDGNGKVASITWTEVIS